MSLRPSSSGKSEASLETPAASRIDGELGALYSRERRAHPESPPRQSRVWERLERSLDLGPRDPDGGGGASVATAPPAKGRSKTTRHLAQLALAAGVIAVFGAEWSVSTRGDAAPPVLVGPEPPRQRPAVVSATGLETTSTPLAISAPVTIDTLPAAGDVPAKVHDAERGLVRTERPRLEERSCTICEERAIIEASRRGLREKQYELALAKILEHEGRFAAGQLAEERESLRIHTLVAMGRTDEAEHRKTVFEAAFPESPLLESVKRAGGR